MFSMFSSGSRALPLLPLSGPDRSLFQPGGKFPDLPADPFSFVIMRVVAAVQENGLRPRLLRKPFLVPDPVGGYLP